jgi:nicotinamidase-related amidase
MWPIVGTSKGRCFPVYWKTSCFGVKEHDLHLEMEDGTFIDVKQTLWPVHCVENTPGSNLHRDLVFTKKDFIVRKGTKRNVESYSAFGDEFRGKYEKTELSDYLKSKK